MDIQLNLPETLAELCNPLFDVLPIESALADLKSPTPVHSELVAALVETPYFLNNPSLAAGIWLYAGDIWKSHTISQSIPDETGAWWHGIMHRLEGDYWNSKYWIRQVDGHPLLNLRPDIEPMRIVESVEIAHGMANDWLVSCQRAEWAALFSWCAEQSLR